ncbi:MAG: large subunit ribosomal protein [Patescibacteria group bacterium]|jgi:large subunit ribosomal protein L22|nr:large subunit ribosomal protein [Patescibacteria group bacterium]
MKAYLKNYRQAPRKVRIVADLIKGKEVSRALLILDTTPKRATRQLTNLVKSAIANAKNNGGISTDGLFIQEIRVDKGLKMRRYMPKAQGRASGYDKHSSNVTLVLGSKAPVVKADKKAAKPAAKKTTKKAVKETK